MGISRKERKGRNAKNAKKKWKENNGGFSSPINYFSRFLPDFFILTFFYSSLRASQFVFLSLRPLRELLA